MNRKVREELNEYDCGKGENENERKSARSLADEENIFFYHKRGLLIGCLLQMTFFLSSCGKKSSNFVDHVTCVQRGHVISLILSGFFFSR